MRGELLPEAEILRYLDEIAEYSGLYNAVGIVWQAAPRDTNWVGRAAETVERRCDEVYRRWKEVLGH